jgi:hypothetical protein
MLQYSDPYKKVLHALWNLNSEQTKGFFNGIPYHATKLNSETAFSAAVSAPKIEIF